jgi:hypothetical protein
LLSVYHASGLFILSASQSTFCSVLQGHSKLIAERNIMVNAVHGKSATPQSIVKLQSMVLGNFIENDQRIHI